MEWRLAQLILATALAMLLLTTLLFADIIFDNYAGTFQWFPRYRIFTGPEVFCDPRWEQAMSFTVPVETTKGFSLEAITVPLSIRYGGPCPAEPNSTLWVSICADNAGIPGALLESIQIDAPKGPYPVPGAPKEFKAVFSGLILLNGGSTYWVVLTGIDDSDHGWCKPAPYVSTSAGMYRELGGEWEPTDADDLAFKVEGTLEISVESKTWSIIKELFSRN